MRRTRIAVAVVIGLLLAGGTVAPAVASSDDELDPQIVEIMAEVPGGVLVDENHVVWPETGMELVVPPAATPGMRMAAVASCATGRICVFTGQSLTGTQLSWGTCGILTIPSTFSAKSIANARSSGSAQARSGSTVLATAGAGGWANIFGSATNVRCLF